MPVSSPKNSALPWTKQRRSRSERYSADGGPGLDKEAAGEETDVAALKEGLEHMLDELHRLTPRREPGNDSEVGVTLAEMVALSGLSEADFHELYLSWVEVEATYFQLYKRAKHVYSEALRVLQFRNVCLQSSSSTSPSTSPSTSSSSPSILHDLGNLMNSSQQSCAQDFECSCPELDRLTALARSSGAYGSRLTGAGWGGCTVSLVREDQVAAFAARLKAEYGPYKDLGEEQMKEVIFATKPSSGAYVFKFDD